MKAKETKLNTKTKSTSKTSDSSRSASKASLISKPETSKPASRDGAGRFVKGQSGNPTGKRKIPEEVRELCRGASVEAINTLVEIMRNTSAKDSDRIKACDIILDRAWGKPYQAVQIDDASDHSISIKWEKAEYGE